MEEKLKKFRQDCFTTWDKDSYKVTTDVGGGDDLQKR